MGDARILIVEDEFLSWQLLQSYVAEYGGAEVAVDGEEAIRKVEAAYEAGRPFYLVFMDIVLPRLDGQAAILAIREYESSRAVPRGERCKIVLTTAP
jgi:two-component system chemotaxis response regulator CheY